MPTLRIGPRDIAVRSPGLHPREAAFVLRRDVAAVRNALRRGVLRASWAGRQRLVDIEYLVEVLAGDPLALEALAGVVEGRIRVPRDGEPGVTLAAAVAAAAGAHRPLSPSLTEALS